MVLSIHDLYISTVSYGGHMHLLGNQSLIELWLEWFAYLKDYNSNFFLT